MTKAKRKAVALTEGQRAYGRTTTRLQIAAAIWSLWERVKESEDLDQQWLADRLGKDKGRVSRLLKEPGNWTMDTVADLLEAMEARLTKVEVMRYLEIAQASKPRAARDDGANQILLRVQEWEEAGEVKVSDGLSFILQSKVNDNESDEEEASLISVGAVRGGRLYDMVEAR
jgi:hypothetical protein